MVDPEELSIVQEMGVEETRVHKRPRPKETMVARVFELLTCWRDFKNRHHSCKLVFSYAHVKGSK